MRILYSFDWGLLILIFLIVGFGLLAVYSAGYDHESDRSPALWYQLKSMAFGFGAFFAIAFFPVRLFKMYAIFAYLFVLGLLVVVFFYGSSSGGATRWLEISSWRMQPSEFMKVAMILFLAKVITGKFAPKKKYDIFSLILPGIIIALPMLIILPQPDLGTALLHGLVGLSMVLAVGIEKETTYGLIVVTALLAWPSWLFLNDYQRKRILTFLSPESDPLGAGYHVIQSKIAVGSGGVFGKGFMQGTQSQLSFLPEQTTDFIFSVIAEEWGFLSSFLLITLYAALIVKLCIIASKVQDPFIGFVTIGIGSLIFWQAIINMGMVMGVMPVVGLTLPLVSFGGSSLISILIALGIVWKAGRRQSSFV